MKKDVKNEILKTTFQLFSEHGYANVSMRNIADALNMSVGNLTYHYSKKEDLVMAVILDQQENFIPPKTPATLKELDDFLSRRLEKNKNDDYFFKYYGELETISPKVHEIQVEAVKKRKKKLQESFKILQQKGLLNDEEIEGHIDALIDVINMIRIYWMPSQEALSSAKESPMDCLWSIIYPRLTVKGKKAFEEEVRS